jgi:hypothetical protein
VFASACELSLSAEWVRWIYRIDCLAMVGIERLQPKLTLQLRSFERVR